MATLEENQRAAQEAATMQRRAFKKSVMTIGGIVVLLALFGLMASTARHFNALTSSPQVTTSPPSKPAASVQWDGGKVPVGEWSQILEVGIGCSVVFSFAPDTHKVQYQYYSKEWKDYQIGTSPNTSHLRFMVLKPGITNVPYTVACKR